MWKQRLITLKITPILWHIWYPHTHWTTGHILSKYGAYLSYTGYAYDFSAELWRLCQSWDCVVWTTQTRRYTSKSSREWRLKNNNNEQLMKKRAHEFETEKGWACGRVWREEREGINDVTLLLSQKRSIKKLWLIQGIPPIISHSIIILFSQ